MNATELELITAAVDGELSAAEARALGGLLARSAAARALYEQLRAQSARLKALPRVAAPADLRARVLAKLAATTPFAEQAGAAEPARFAWIPAAIAATVFLAVAGASFAYFSSAGSKTQVARHPWANTLPSPHEAAAAPAPPVAAPVKSNPDAVVRLNVHPVPQPAPDARDAARHSHAAVAIAPPPRGIDPDLIGYPLRPVLPAFDRIDARLPFLHPVADLGREDVQQELHTELRPGSALKFDVFVRDPARGVDVFQRAARAAGLTVHTDGATAERLKRKQVHAVAVYMECLTPAELIALFARLSAEDAKFSPRVCDALHVAPVARSEEAELKLLLGADVGLFKRAAVGAGQGSERDPDPKPLSAGTVDSVVKSVGGSTALKGSEHPAVLMTWPTTPTSVRTNPAASSEIKQYLARRGERKPNAVPVLVVIRSPG